MKSKHKNEQTKKTYKKTHSKKILKNKIVITQENENKKNRERKKTRK
jgi:hypothetical protein